MRQLVRFALHAALLAGMLSAPAPADDDDQIARFEHEVRRLDEIRANALEERDRAAALSGEARERLSRIEATEGNLEREAAGIEEELAHGEAIAKELRRVSGEVAEAYSRYRRDPGNEAIYRELQDLKARHGAIEGESAAFSLRRGELASRLDRLGRERAGLEEERASARRGYEEARRQLEEARARFESRDRALSDFVRSDATLREFYEATRRFEPKVRAFFDDLVDRFGDQEPGTSRTIELALEGEAEVTLYKALGLKAGTKYRVLLKRTEDGDYELTVIGEGSLGVGLGVKGDHVSAGGDVAGVARTRLVYRFDPDQTGEMMTLATLIGTGGIPLGEALRYVDDEAYRYGVGTLSAWAEEEARTVGDGFAALATGAELLGWDRGAEILRGPERAAAIAGEAASDARDFALAVKYASSIQPPSDQFTNTIIEGALRGNARAKLGSLGKIEGEVEVAMGYESRREGQAIRDVESYSLQLKGGTQVRAGVGAHEDGSRKTVLKYVRDAEGKLIRAEIVFKGSEEAGAGFGAGDYAVAKGLGSRTTREVQIKDPTPEDVEFIESVLVSDDAGLVDPERTIEDLRRGFLLSRNEKGRVVEDERFSELVRTSTVDFAQANAGASGGKVKIKGTRFDTRTTVISGDPDLRANSHEVGEDGDS